ncbi:hypothetical protein EVAR_46597_1 [Eumeta japonica]|uniref:Uncharacterized protein n=1 Tax=Eumeta variegata TaxID=151549 RepID=A0A4C1WR51_EUMVA|nr:hypothetical protein EVAR_46597_1 [Eumeta japonica]
MLPRSDYLQYLMSNIRTTLAAALRSSFLVVCIRSDAPARRGPYPSGRYGPVYVRPRRAAAAVTRRYRRPGRPAPSIITSENYDIVDGDPITANVPAQRNVIINRYNR